MKASIHLGRTFGVRVGLHYSWFFIAALIFLSLIASLSAAAPDASAAMIWLTSAATTLVFFAGLLVHELSHALVARARGVKVNSITLFALGGVAETAEESSDPATEFMIGAVGPVTSAALGAIFLGASVLLNGLPPSVSALLRPALVWLGVINLGLAAFNLLPGYPMDGGRVLRAAVWKMTGSRGRATRTAARGGQAVSSILILLGAAALLGGGGFGGLWLVFIGLFLFQAATTGLLTAEAFEALRSLSVGDLMNPDPPAASPEEPLEEVVRDRMLRRGSRCLAVRRDGRLLGLVTAREVARVPKKLWGRTTTEEAMVPSSRLRTVAPTASALEALEIMSREDVGQLLVKGNGGGDGAAGFVSREDIVRTLTLRRELEG